MIEVNNLTRVKISKIGLKRVALYVLTKEGRKDEGLSIALVSEKRSQELNATYRKKDKPANVLSFTSTSCTAVPRYCRRVVIMKCQLMCQNGGRQMTQCGGTVLQCLSYPISKLLICPAVVRKDAKKYDILFTSAMTWMVIHGLLHLLGYSHKTMEKREVKYRAHFQ